MSAAGLDRVVVALADPEHPADVEGLAARAGGLEVVLSAADVDTLVHTIGDGRRTAVVAATPDEQAAAGVAATRTGAQLRDHDLEPVEHEPPADTALDDLHAEAADPWGVDSRWYEERKRHLLLAALPRRRFGHAVEVGSSTGALAADLADRCDDLLVLDASPHAIAAARQRLGGLDHVRVEQRVLPDQWPPAPAGGFDLVVVSEVGYFLSPAGLDDLVAHLRRDLAADGVLVLCHWRHPMVGWPLDGPAVHAVVRAAGLRPVVASYVDRDVELLVLGEPDALPDPGA